MLPQKLKNLWKFSKIFPQNFLKIWQKLFFPKDRELLTEYSSLFFEIEFFAEFVPKTIMYNWNGLSIIVLWCCVEFGTWFERLEVLISIHMGIFWFESVCLSPSSNSSSSPKQSKKIRDIDCIVKFEMLLSSLC